MTAIAIDTETTGPYLYRGCKPFMVTACTEDGKLYEWDFPVDPITRCPQYDGDTIENIKRRIGAYDEWVFHNALFDLRALQLLGISNFSGKDIHDTMLMAHCHNSLDRLGLKGLAFQYLDFPEDDEQDLHKTVTKARRIAKKLGLSYADPSHPDLTPLKDKKGHCDYWLPQAISCLSPEKTGLSATERKHFKNVCRKYALGDVERTMGLYIIFGERLRTRKDYQYYEQNRTCLLPTFRMQSRGFTFKKDLVKDVRRRLSNVKEAERSTLGRISGQSEFNPKSPIQLRQALYEKLHVDASSFTDTGQASTDKNALKDILSYPEVNKTQEQFCRHLLTYRKITTAEQYMESYVRHQVDGKLYSNLNPVGTTTTRYSHKDPNAGNISKQESDEENYDLTVTINLREAFGPPEGKLWICIDYAQLQLRIFAHACDDAFLIDSFHQGLDIHDTVAREVFATEKPTSLQRRAAKAINFGIIFGAGRNRIERMSGIDGSYDLFRQRFPLVSRYLRACEMEARKTGMIRTLGGYPLRVQRQKAYKACNFVVQGTEGEMVKNALDSCDQYCRQKYVPIHPIMIIHDEIIFETKKAMTLSELNKRRLHLQFVAKLMNAAGKAVGVDTEVDCKVTRTLWSDAKSYSLVGPKQQLIKD